ncbi:methyltransferase domain-containing protein [Alteromonas sediminis]|uniref:tRNA (guanine(46)-N(7))-methyltransferase n=1 Tax=Alteromonas sediminis TaxID=2259342 RepID=A0A3N5YJL4_9ALTE|nr:methyltransferase domain-containing protein [Alteromonas sediminis]RPJ64841.1 methyltransferase domain-containing protein [Alteromonas sediminis]
MQQARTITTRQTGLHDKLIERVNRYRLSRSRRPIAAHTQRAFEDALAWLGDGAGEIILDSCCGVGESTAKLAERFPAAKVIGLDKSVARLDKHHAYQHEGSNYRVIRADVNDFWRLAHDNALTFNRHYLLYPNPYPKPSQLQKRWYASDVMPSLMAISNTLEVRSNWLLYLQEFEQAAMCYGVKGNIRNLDGSSPMTPFERKYRQSGQQCFALQFENMQ